MIHIENSLAERCFKLEISEKMLCFPTNTDVSKTATFFKVSLLLKKTYNILVTPVTELALFGVWWTLLGVHCLLWVYLKALVTIGIV